MHALFFFNFTILDENNESVNQLTSHINHLPLLSKKKSPCMVSHQLEKCVVKK
jgi:hypothetical protein